MSPATTGLAQSVHTRLIAHARKLHVDPNLVLARYAAERFLYRLSRSPHGDRFVLKGALLMLAWFGETIRPTRDADLLGLEPLSDEALAALFKEVCAVTVEADGMRFDPGTVGVSAIREGDARGGLRVTLQGRLGNAKLGVQVDVGWGDAITPAARWLRYPAMLDFPRPRLHAYPPETVIAEKLHAMVKLGRVNSWMRDFHDVFVLQAERDFRGSTLVRAVRATFRRRETALPEVRPVALTAEFAKEASPRWRAFVLKNGLRSAPQEFGPVVAALDHFLGPVVEALQGAGGFTGRWQRGGRWTGVKRARRG